MAWGAAGAVAPYNVGLAVALAVGAGAGRAHRANRVALAFRAAVRQVPIVVLKTVATGSTSNSWFAGTQPGDWVTHLTIGASVGAVAGRAALLHTPVTVLAAVALPPYVEWPALALS